MDHKKLELSNFSFMSPLISFRQSTPIFQQNQNPIFSPYNTSSGSCTKRNKKPKCPPFKCILKTQNCSTISNPVQSSHKSEDHSHSHKNPLYPQNHDISLYPTQQFAMKITFENPWIFSSSSLISPYPMHLKFLPSKKVMVQQKILSLLLKVM
jgi:hypothetical protein